MNSADRICQEVKEMLLKEDNININIKTIKAVAEIMKENNNPIFVRNLYFNCIVDGIDDLIEYDKEIMRG